ncbi:MAG TPA: zf-HC2 domain-containing protein [Polyangia bacterium]|nr:zf-HC2 domain-containing protein [Polyangia bacterium]
MDCARAKDLLGDSRAGRLDGATPAALEAHLAGCADCRRAAAVERALDAALAERLPRHRASADFERRLRDRLAAAGGTARPAAGPSPPSARAAARPGGGWRVFATPAASALGAAALVVLALRVAAPRAPAGAPNESAPGASLASSLASWDLVDEAVSDHLRVVASTHPPEIASGGIHQVKPWFTGRVDFAPRVAFAGDDDFPLVGGSLGYVRDHKAAVFQFRRRLHAITLLVFPAAGLPWPSGAAVSLGRHDVVERTARGFSVLLWRDADLGYALVSDVARPELEALVSKITPAL